MQDDFFDGAKGCKHVPDLFVGDAIGAARHVERVGRFVVFEFLLGLFGRRRLLFSPAVVGLVAARHAQGKGSVVGGGGFADGFFFRFGGLG